MSRKLRDMIVPGAKHGGLAGDLRTDLNLKLRQSRLDGENVINIPHRR